MRLTSPLVDSSNPQCCGMHLLRGLSNGASYPGNRRSLGPLPVAGLQVRTALPQTSLKWRISAFQEEINLKESRLLGSPGPGGRGFQLHFPELSYYVSLANAPGSSPPPRCFLSPTSPHLPCPRWMSVWVLSTKLDTMGGNYRKTEFTSIQR